MLRKNKLGLKIKMVMFILNTYVPHIQRVKHVKQTHRVIRTKPKT